MTTYDNSQEPWNHPLIRRPERAVSRRLFLLGGASAAVGLVAMPGGRTAVAQEPVATPDVRLEGDEDAVALLESAANAIAELDTFAFSLETTRGTSTIMEGFELKNVEGVVRRPVDVQATITMGIPFGEISATAVGVDGEFWVEDPLSADETWIYLGSDPQFQALINPDRLILLAVRLVQDAQITGTEKVAGAETTIVEGTVDFVAAAEAAIGDDASMIAEFLAEGPKDVIFWIDEEHRVVEAEIVGPLLTTESEDVVRVLSLFDFNEPVEIEIPEGA